MGVQSGVTDPYDCLNICGNTTDCQWYTLNPEIESCELFATCNINNDGSCPLCVTGSAFTRATKPKLIRI